MKGANRQHRPQKIGSHGVLAALAAAFGQTAHPSYEKAGDAFRRGRIRSSRHTPHQGHQECARRVRQMASGFIKA